MEIGTNAGESHIDGFALHVFTFLVGTLQFEMRQRVNARGCNIG